MTVNFDEFAWGNPHLLGRADLQALKEMQASCNHPDVADWAPMPYSDERVSSGAEFRRCRDCDFSVEIRVAADTPYTCAGPCKQKLMKSQVWCWKGGYRGEKHYCKPCTPPPP